MAGYCSDCGNVACVCNLMNNKSDECDVELIRFFSNGHDFKKYYKDKIEKLESQNKELIEILEEVQYLNNDWSIAEFIKDTLAKIKG